MKIVLNAAYDHPSNSGGVSTFNRNIIKILENNDLKVLAYKTTKIKLFTQKIDQLIEFYPKNRIFRNIDSKIFRYNLQRILTKRLVKKIKPQICILNSPKDLNSIVEVRNIGKVLVQHINFDSYLKIYKIDRKKLQELIKKIDYFICLSEYDKYRFINELNIEKKFFKVIRHTSEIDILKNEKEKNMVLIMIARLDNRQKRFDLAIKVMKKLPEFTLKIYGAGPDKENLQALIAQEKVENVYLMGGTNKIQEALDKASIFIMTSDFEGYPISNIEAMRRGLPIILRNTFEAAQDIIVDNQNGILLGKEWDEDQFIEAVYKIYGNYEYYSKNAIILGKRYNKEIIEEEWQNLMNRVNKK